MRWSRWIVVFVMGLSLGCGEPEEPEEEDPVQAPEPVAPLEVATPDVPEVEGVDVPEAVAEGAPTETEANPEAPETLESLRARVAELEAQLASCQGGTTPEGVDVPEADDPATARAETTRRQGGETAPRSRSLLGTLLGDDEPERPREREGQGDEPEPIELPDPTRILLGP